MRRSYGTVLGLAIGIAALSVGSLAAAQDVPERVNGSDTSRPKGELLGKPNVGGKLRDISQALGEQAEPAEAAPAKKTAVDVEKLLDSTRIKVEFFETPLKDVCGYFSEILNIDVLIDKQELQGLTITEDSPVTIQISKSEVSARTVLELLLRQLSPDCVAMPKDGLLLITSEQNSYITVSYDLAELFGVDPRDARSRMDITEATALLQLIKSKVAPDSWMEAGGRGSIDIFRTSLIVKNSPKVQREIRDVLEMLPPKQLPVALPPPVSGRRPAPVPPPDPAPAPAVEPMKPAPEEEPAPSPAERLRNTAATLLDRMDANKDGKLQKEELGKWAAFYQGADTNSDEILTVDEIIQHMQKVLAEPPKPTKPPAPAPPATPPAPGNALPPPLPPTPAAPPAIPGTP